MLFEPSHTAAISRLDTFLTKAGRDYAQFRNYDIEGHPHVSGLSPYLRHGLVQPEDVLRQVLRHHTAAAAEKFIQEVFWRSYWKGWLERRPSVWCGYQAQLRRDLDQLSSQAGLRLLWEDACLGRTGIACFDAWAHELVATGYLHNHARMWFASIWVFTLDLPWALGADFFLRHLLDGDPASNTLGWRWVAGRQTLGKTYLARSENIARYTKGRFVNTPGLAQYAKPCDPEPHPSLGPAPTSDAMPGGRVAVLVTEEDVLPQDLVDTVADGTAVVALRSDRGRSVLEVSAAVQDFTQGALQDGLNRLGAPDAPIFETPEDVTEWARAQHIDAFVTRYCPQGPARTAVTQIGIPVSQQIKPFDRLAWPHATAGFFKFKAHIPKILGALEQPQLL